MDEISVYIDTRELPRQETTELNAFLKAQDGIELTRYRMHLQDSVGTPAELLGIVIFLSPALKLVGQKALDLASDLIKQHFKKKGEEVEIVTIVDSNGRPAAKVKRPKKG